jgi:stress response protein YsnF
MEQGAMDRHNIVAVFNTRGEAERAVQELVTFGIPAEDIRLGGADADLGTAATTARTEDWSQDRRHGFWDWLFGNDVPEEHRNWYAANLREGKTALSVLLHDAAQRDRVSDILERCNPVDIDEEGLVEPAVMTPPPTAGMMPGTGTPGIRQPAAGMRAEAPELTKEGEQVIPVLKEELQVGKRATERRYRIRTYTVETPVEQQVSLHDERVIIEHRPASGAARTDAGSLRERDFEVVERHEEPVVEKRARPVEEVVVRREGSDHVETVRDTVRETKVDVDKEAAEHQLEGERPVNPRRP